MKTNVALLLYFGVLAFFGLFFVLPIAIAVRGAFLDQTGALTLDYVREVFRNPIYLEGFTNALRLAVGSTFFAFAIAAPLAWISERFEFPAKRILSAFLLLPMMLPPFVGAIGLRQIFGQEGAVNALLHAVGFLGQHQVIDWLGSGREWGIIALNALHLYPILYLNLVAALANLDPALLDDAMTDVGAGAALGARERNGERLRGAQPKTRADRDRDHRGGSREALVKTHPAQSIEPAFRKVIRQSGSVR